MSAQEKTAGGLSRRNLWAYPVGTVGRDMAGCMFTNYLLTYVLFTKTLTSVQFACISVIMVAARVFDAFNDPIMGNVVEATRTRWGKFKPWIAIGGVLSVIVFITSFSTTLQGWAYVAAFGLLYFAYSVVFTMNDIAYWGMVPALARRADDRNRLTSRTVLFAGVGQFLGGIVVPTFTAGSLVIGGNRVPCRCPYCMRCVYGYTAHHAACGARAVCAGRSARRKGRHPEGLFHHCPQRSACLVRRCFSDFFRGADTDGRRPFGDIPVF